MSATDATDTAPPGGAPSYRLRFSAISDVGRVRKDNQDSGYVGPWLLAVCDGVGGAARGDIASSTAIAQLRKLDEDPTATAGDDDALLGQIAGAIHRAHDRISELVDEDPSLSGTSTTATVALFDGRRLGVGHVGDSRAYLFRDGQLRQLTSDHTFVQSLIDEGRISEDEARVHPHRHLIIRALDGVGETEPDLFLVDLLERDRLLLCSDGASGVLPDGRLADILSFGTPDYAAVELVRASLEAGSSDNVTCIVADVVDAATPVDPDTEAGTTPLLVGAAAELRRRNTRGNRGAGVTGSLFRGHRSGDTGELEPVRAEIAGSATAATTREPPDPETARYAPRPPRRHPLARRLLLLAVVVGVVWIAAAAAWSWSQEQYFIGESNGEVVIYRGLDTDVVGVSLNHLYEVSDVELDRLTPARAETVADGIPVDSLDEARTKVRELAATQTVSDTEDAG